ncbi:MAG: hypothetical protein ACI31A_05315 [Candidatus Limisoma sp.]
MNCLTKAVGTIVSALLFVNVAFVSNAEDWNGEVAARSFDYIDGGNNVYNINLTGDVTLAGTITIDRHVTVIIKNTSGSTKTIKGKTAFSTLFKDRGTLIIEGTDDKNRIIIDGGANLTLAAKDYRDNSDISINSGNVNNYSSENVNIASNSVFSSSNGFQLDWELIGSQGILSLKYVTIQNFYGKYFTSAAVKLGCNWSSSDDDKFMGDTTIDHCIFQFLTNPCGSAIYMTGDMTASSNASPQNRNQVVISNSEFRYCHTSGYTSAGYTLGGAIYTDNAWKGQVYMTNTKMHNNWTPKSCSCIKWTALGYTWVKLFIQDGCEFSYNVSGADAGALYVETLCDFAAGTIKINNNKCLGYGGGLYIKPMNLGSISGPYNYTLPASVEVGYNNDGYNNDTGVDCKGGGVAVRITWDCDLASGSTINLIVNGANIHDNNGVAEGGGIYFTHENTDKNYTCNVYLNSGTVANNVAYKNNSVSNGGGLYVWRTNILNDASKSGVFTFEKNRCEGYGGAICQQNNGTYDTDGFAVPNEGRIELRNSQMTFKSANEAVYGGAIAAWNSDAVTLENISFSGNGPTNYGNGLWTQDCKSVNLNGCSFTGNNGFKYGGGVYANHVILNSVNSNYNQNNGSYRGAGLYITNNSTATITGGQFYKNKLIGSFHDDEKPGYEGYGAGLYFGNGGTLTVNGVTFNNNEVKATEGSATGGGGGAIAIVNQRYYLSDEKYKFTEVEVDHAVANTTATLEGLSMAANQAISGDGGAIMIRSVNEDSKAISIEKAKVIEVTLKSSTITNNQAARGGAILADGNDYGKKGTVVYDDAILTMDNVTMTDNKATYGGAIGICQAKGTFNSGTIYNNSATADAVNEVSAKGGMWDNSAKGFGGGIFVSTGAIFNIEPASGALCAIYGNTATNGGDDIVCDGVGSAQVALPDLATANLGTYTGTYPYPVSQSAMGWIEDYNPGDLGYDLGFKKGTTGRYRIKRENREEGIENTMLSAEQRTSNSGTYLALSAGFPIYYAKLQKNGLNLGESAIFKIYGGSFTSEKPYLTTVLTGNGSDETSNKIALTPGPWTVEETGWSWSYTNTTGKTIDIDVAESTDGTKFEFSNDKKSDVSPHAESVKQNELNKKTE